MSVFSQAHTAKPAHCESSEHSKEPEQARTHSEMLELLRSIPQQVDQKTQDRVMASMFAACGGSDEGLRAFRGWRAIDPFWDPDRIEKEWFSIKVDVDDGLPALAKIAKEHGADIQEIAERHGSLTHVLASQLPDLSDKERDEIGSRTAALGSSIIRGRTAAPVLTNDYLIKGWLGRGEFSVLFGPPGAGKTFVALDIANHVAKGIDWNGHKVCGGPVIYFASEGGVRLQNRLVAVRGGKADDMVLVTKPINLFLGGIDLAAITRLAKQEAGGAPALIVIDTLARAMAGGDENSGDDMGQIINRVDQLRDATGAHVMLVHHSGKHTQRGARGHSSLNGAEDTELECRVESHERLLIATKQKELETGSQLTYRLVPSFIGVDEDGDEKFSCSVEFGEKASGSSKRKGMGRNQRALLKCFHRLSDIADQGASGGPEDGAVLGVDQSELLSAASSEMGKSDEKANKRAANDALKDVLKRGALAQNGSLILLPSTGNEDET